MRAKLGFHDNFKQNKDGHIFSNRILKEVMNGRHRIIKLILNVNCNVIVHNIAFDQYEQGACQ